MTNETQNAQPFDWNDKNAVNYVLNFAREIQSQCWLPMNGARGGSIAVDDVFFAPVFHAGTNAKVIMFSININNLTAMEVLFTPHGKTRLDVDLYYPNGETHHLISILGDIRLSVVRTSNTMDITWSGDDESPINKKIMDKMIKQIKLCVVASWDAVNKVATQE